MTTQRLQRITLLCMLTTLCAHADTMDHYMNIANNIPQMEMKADSQAQAWARSARNILTLTSESIAESLTLANESAKRTGNPLFCLPNSVTLNAPMMNNLIQQTYREISSQQSDKERMTVSQVALLGISKQYPCQRSTQTRQLTPALAINQALHPGNSVPELLR